MRTYKIMKEKVQQFNENKEIQDLLKEIHGANPQLRGVTAKYSKEAAQKLKAWRSTRRRWRRASCRTSGWISW